LIINSLHLYLGFQVQRYMTKVIKKGALTPEYSSQNQLSFDGFEIPFDKKLNSKNRWVILAHLIPWDEICTIYLKSVPKKDWSSKIKRKNCLRCYNNQASM